jgi:hypothetical protein
MRNIVPQPPKISSSEAKQLINQAGRSMHDLRRTGRIDLGGGKYVTLCRRQYFLNGVPMQDTTEIDHNPPPATVEELVSQWREEFEELQKNGIEAQRERAVLHLLTKG